MQVGIQNIKILLFVISLGLGFKFLKKKKKKYFDYNMEYLKHICNLESILLYIKKKKIQTLLDNYIVMY